MATLADLKTYGQRNGWPDTSATGIAQQVVWINNTLAFLALERRWSYYQTPYWFNFTAPYTTGTVTVTKAGTGVEGSGTTFASGMAGQEFYTTEDAGRVYNIASITDGDTLVLSSAYLGDTTIGASYSINYVRYAAPTDWGMAGPAYFEDGRELVFADVGFEDWLRLRAEERGNTSATPDFLLYKRIAGTGYFYTHPAPSAAAQVRMTYQRLPAALSGDSDAADLPAVMLPLLHEALRINISIGDQNAAMEALRSREYQRLIDKAFAAERPHGSVPIVIGGSPPAGKRTLNGLGAIMKFSGYE